MSHEQLMTASQCFCSVCLFSEQQLMNSSSMDIEQHHSFYYMSLQLLSTHIQHGHLKYFAPHFTGHLEHLNCVRVQTYPLAMAKIYLITGSSLMFYSYCSTKKCFIFVMIEDSLLLVWQTANDYSIKFCIDSPIGTLRMNMLSHIWLSVRSSNYLCLMLHRIIKPKTNVYKSQDLYISKEKSQYLGGK